MSFHCIFIAPWTKSPSSAEGLIFTSNNRQVVLVCRGVAGAAGGGGGVRARRGAPAPLARVHCAGRAAPGPRQLWHHTVLLTRLQQVTTSLLSWLCYLLACRRPYIFFYITYLGLSQVLSY